MSGPNQMATDMMLLEKVKLNSDISIALRFYQWKGLCLSVGKNQKKLPSNWIDLAKRKEIKIIRRPSGGNAVLHSGGLTYALIWRSPPRRKREAYYLASQWLIKGFADLGLPLIFGNQSANPSEKNCFSTSTLADLIDPLGNKRIGSAQVWQKGSLLQHGEILLDPPAKLWMEIFKTKAPKPASISIPKISLVETLYKACRSCWPEVSWQDKKLTKKEYEKITINSMKYALNINQPDLSINPAESIASTASGRANPSG